MNEKIYYNSLIMKSIRTKTTLLTVIAIIVSTCIATVIGVTAIRNIGNSSSDKMLLLLCETGQKNLDYYFESVEQSVDMLASFIEEDMDGIDDASLSAHLERAETLFEKTAYATNGVLTYYYRIDPHISETEKGFWFTNLDGEGFEEHEPTDITLYDIQDTSKLVWFTVPMATGKSIWLPPYITDNLDVRVISYNTPIYYEGKFVGVIGIEIDYSTMAEQVDNIRLYDNGYAFINDAEGNIIYHPNIDVTQLTEETKPKVPDGLLSTSQFIRYNFEGVDKVAVWLPLSNGMRLNVTVPVNEINGGWMNMIFIIIAAAIILVVIFSIVTLRFTGRITKPLRELTDAARQIDEGNYDVRLDYDGKDEVGLLTRTFRQLTGHLKTYIGDLNNLAYADALTSVHNKGAYDLYVRELQEKILGSDGDGKYPEFAIAEFDCDDLKMINDRYGHEKGDIYLKTASHLICTVFQHSPVYRTGGDEFTVILQNHDFEKRNELLLLFEQESAMICEMEENPWEQVRVAVGMAVFDPEADKSVQDVARQADRLMYENKQRRKKGR